MFVYINARVCIKVLDVEGVSVRDSIVALVLYDDRQRDRTGSADSVSVGERPMYRSQIGGHLFDASN